MGRKKRKKPSERSSVEDVLAGRRRPNVRELIDLIRDVNPRGDEADAADRYDVKTRLQSLLIDTFSDELEVVEDLEAPGTVILRHRYGGGSALHAMVDNLEPDARAWVRRVLDERQIDGDLASQRPKKAGPTSDESPPRGTPDALVARGTAALEAYDYEAAEQLYRAAFEGPGGGSVATVPLLTFLVEHLAAYAEALALDVDESVPRVRGLLALAAARMEDVPKSLRYVEGVTGEAAAEVWARAVEAAVAARDEALARQRVQRLRDVDPSHPEIVAVEAKLEALQTEALAPEEARLTEMWQADPKAPATKEFAEQLRSQFPQSPVARRVLQQIADRERTEALAALMQEVEAATDPTEEIHALEKILQIDPTSSGIAERLALARERAKDAQASAQVTGVLQTFESGARSQAFHGYLDLGEDQRRQIRTMVDEPALEWLDRMDTRSRARKDAAVEAVLAVALAERAVEKGDMLLAREHLSAHREWLIGIELVQKIENEVSNWTKAQRFKEVELARADVRGHLARGELAAARASADAVALFKEPTAAEELAAIAWLQQTVDLEARVRVALKKDDTLPRASGLIDELMGRLKDPAARDQWRESFEQLQEKLKDRLKIHIEEGEVPIMHVPLNFPNNRDLAPMVVTPDGRELVLAKTRGPWLFVQVVDWSTRQVRAFSMQAPESLGDVEVRVVVTGDRIHLGTGFYRMVTLHLKTLALLGYESFQPHVTAEEKFRPRGASYGGPVPGGRYYWLGLDNVTTAVQKSRIIDLEKGTHRDVEDLTLIGALATTQGPRVVARIAGRGLGLTAPSGAAERKPTTGIVVHALALFESNEVEAVAYSVSGAKPPNTNLYVGVRIGDQVHSSFVLDTSLYQLTMLTSAHRVHIRFETYSHQQTPRSQSWLLTAELENTSLKEVYRCRIPDNAALLQNERGGSVNLGWFTPSDLEVVPLNEDEPPRIDRLPYPLRTPWLFYLVAPCPCDIEFDSEQQEIQERFEHLSKDELGEEIEARRSQPKEIVPLLREMFIRPDGITVVKGELRRVINKRMPLDVKIRLQLAELAGLIFEWGLMELLLDPIERGRLKPALEWSLEYGSRVRDHYYHLMAHALYMQRRLRRFRKVIQHAVDLLEDYDYGDGEMPDDRCPLESYLALTKPYAGVDPDTVPVQHDYDEVREVAAAVSVYDMAVKEGDRARALRAIDRPAVWRSEERQCLARLLDGLLSVSGDETSVFRLRLAAACFMWRQTTYIEDSRELCMLELRWKGPQLKNLERRAVGVWQG